MSIQFERISAHMINERMDRYIFIQTHTGIGNPVVEIYVPERDHIEMITDTGVLLVTDKEKKVLITCFYVHLDKAVAIFQGATNDTITREVRNAIKMNAKRNYMKLQNECG